MSLTLKKTWKTVLKNNTKSKLNLKYFVFKHLGKKSIVLNGKLPRAEFRKPINFFRKINFIRRIPVGPGYYSAGEIRGFDYLNDVQNATFIAC